MPSSDRPPVFARVLWQVTQYFCTSALSAAAFAVSAATLAAGEAGVCGGVEVETGDGVAVPRSACAGTRSARRLDAAARSAIPTTSRPARRIRILRTYLQLCSY